MAVYKPAGGLVQLDNHIRDVVARSTPFNREAWYFRGYNDMPRFLTIQPNQITPAHRNLHALRYRNNSDGTSPACASPSPLAGASASGMGLP
jgi:hypothetical protein